MNRPDGFLYRHTIHKGVLKHLKEHFGNVFAQPSQDLPPVPDFTAELTEDLTGEDLMAALKISIDISVAEVESSDQDNEERAVWLPPGNIGLMKESSRAHQPTLARAPSAASTRTGTDHKQTAPSGPTLARAHSAASTRQDAGALTVDHEREPSDPPSDRARVAFSGPAHLGQSPLFSGLYDANAPEVPPLEQQLWLFVVLALLRQSGFIIVVLAATRRLVDCRQVVVASCENASEQLGPELVCRGSAKRGPPFVAYQIGLKAQCKLKWHTAFAVTRPGPGKNAMDNLDEHPTMQDVTSRLAVLKFVLDTETLSLWLAFNGQFYTASLPTAGSVSCTNT
ncbi:hypothetical protein PENSPDRAFT_672294 [Peniophora sp. CONT]|nr:hypothetical protein PENSPDRAFT_672294 [Peniophora sp. CONT]